MFLFTHVSCPLPCGPQALHSLLAAGTEIKGQAPPLAAIFINDATFLDTVRVARPGVGTNNAR
jgi:hypothetical protein